MDIKRENVLKLLAERFAIFSNVVTTQNKVGLNDINKSAERLFIYILNIAFNVDLQDMNAIQDNYPAIDLADDSAKFCVQVTSDATNKKFRNTVAKFKEKQLDKKFDKLIFLIISNKNTCNILDQKVQTEVINLDDLYKIISKLEDRDIFDIDRYLSDNLVSRIELSDSILPPEILRTYSILRPDALINFLGWGNDVTVIEQLQADLKGLSQKISKLTKNQRECLFYIVTEGEYNAGDRVIITYSQLYQVLGGNGVRAFHVLMEKGLLLYDDEYCFPDCDYYVPVVVPIFEGKLEDTNLFYIIKKFCGDDIKKMRQILLDCNFSALA